MTASPRSLFALALILATPACLLTPDVIGETLTEGQQESHSTATDGSGPVTTSATTEVSDNPNPLAYGQPCELGPPEAWEETSDPPDEDDIVQPQATVLSVSEQCVSGMCLLSYDDQVPIDCETDADCGDPELACADFDQCVLTPAYVAEHARCTQTCDSAADCPAIPGCETGVSCAIVSLLGQNCCQPVCVCNDRHSVGRSETLAAQCAQGFEGCP